jgi:predicted ATPase/DNA-binding SARP family transcriptional activator
MPRLEIGLLGPPEIKIDGRPVRSDRRKAVALLAYLAVTGQPQARDHLAGLLWPGYDQDSALAYLRRTLWELNQMLGKGFIEADRERAALAPSARVWLDTAVLEAALHERPLSVEALSGAASLYRDDFLAGFSVPDTAAFEEWQLAQAEHFRRRLAAVLESLVQALAQAGAQAALPHARRWLSLDPLNEAAHRAIMRLLAGMGDRTGAIRQYEACVQALKQELGISPQPETTRLYEAILHGANGAEGHPAPAADSAARPPSHLPVAPTPFIGRRPEVEQVKALVQHPAQRLVTLVGPGGAGKTRLSIQAASELEGDFPDGVYFAPLATVQAPEAVLPALAKALDFSFYREEESQRQQLLDYLCEKRLMLILDNFEHLTDASGLIVDILERATGVKLMVTSRVRLNVHGEQLYPVAGMRIPDPAEAEAWQDPEAQARPYSAVQLFIERARRVQPGFGLTRDNIRPVMDICRLVHGMPLGLELAAAWLELLPPAEVAAEIRRSLDFLATEQPNVPERQRSIRAVFDWSWKLLGDDERRVFQRLCVFVGTFSRAAAEHVAGASLRMLLGLANKSWLQQTAGGRFQLHELMRQYGLERLQADPAEWQLANDRHAEYFSDFVAAQFERLKGPEQREGLLAVDEEFDTNIKAAGDWLAAQQRWTFLVERLVPGVFDYIAIRWRTDEIIPWVRPIRRKLAASSAPEHRLPLAIISTLEIFCEESSFIKDTSLRDRLTALWHMVEEHDLAQAMGFWYVILAGLAYYSNQNLQAGARLSEAVERVRAHGDAWQLGYSLLISSNMWLTYSLDEARLLEAAQIFANLGVAFERGIAAEALGRHAFQQKRSLAEVTNYYQQAAQFYEHFGHFSPASISHAELAGIYLQQGDIDKAFAYLRKEREKIERSGNQRMLVYYLHWEALYAARFSTFEHAFQARQRCLEVAGQDVQPAEICWQHFELAETYRIFGHWEQALPEFEQADRCFVAKNLVLGLGYGQRAKGDYAMHQGRYADALAHYHSYLSWCRQENHLWSLAHGRGKVALALARLEDREQARAEMRAALAETRDLVERDLSLQAMLAEPVCLMQAGQHERAAELAAFIAHHPVSWNETKQQARAMLVDASSHLPAETAAAAIERGRSRLLEDVIAELLGD